MNADKIGQLLALWSGLSTQEGQKIQKFLCERKDLGKYLRFNHSINDETWSKLWEDSWTLPEWKTLLGHELNEHRLNLVGETLGIMESNEARALLGVLFEVQENLKVSDLAQVLDHLDGSMMVLLSETAKARNEENNSIISLLEPAGQGFVGVAQNMRGNTLVKVAEDLLEDEADLWNQIALAMLAWKERQVARLLLEKRSKTSLRILWHTALQEQQARDLLTASVQVLGKTETEKLACMAQSNPLNNKGACEVLSNATGLKPVHLLKTTRNALEPYKISYDEAKGVITWLASVSNVALVLHLVFEMRKVAVKLQGGTRRFYHRSLDSGILDATSDVSYAWARLENDLWFLLYEATPLEKLQPENIYFLLEAGETSFEDFLNKSGVRVYDTHVMRKRVANRSVLLEREERIRELQKMQRWGRTDWRNPSLQDRDESRPELSSSEREQNAVCTEAVRVCETDPLMWKTLLVLDADINGDIDAWTLVSSLRKL